MKFAIIRRTWTLLCVVLLVLLAPPSVGQTEQEDALNRIYYKVVSASNTFGFRLFSELFKQNSKNNIFICPASTSLALSAVCNGARGDTQKSIADALSLTGIPLDDVNKASAAMLASLNDPYMRVQLAIANSLWTDKQTVFRPEFIDTVKQYYQAQVENLDFSNPDAPTQINSWVNEKTQGKIPSIINRLGPDTDMIILNAVYFKGG